MTPVNAGPTHSTLCKLSFVYFTIFLVSEEHDSEIDRMFARLIDRKFGLSSYVEVGFVICAFRQANSS